MGFGKTKGGKGKKGGVKKDGKGGGKRGYGAAVTSKKGAAKGGKNNAVKKGKGKGKKGKGKSSKPADAVDLDKELAEYMGEDVMGKRLDAELEDYMKAEA